MCSPQNNNDNDLTEPLLPSSEQQNENDVETGSTSSSSSSSCRAAFSLRGEIGEMAHLGIPLAVSFFCRMGMASMDSAFVGHIQDELHKAETYLAAALLSDMIVNICITPPLAFNQVLNGLVGQAIGSGNHQMAGIWLQQSMFWLSLTMLPCLTGLYYVEPVLLALGFPEAASHLAGVYAKYNIIWPIPNGLYQCMRFYFQAQGLPRPAMYNGLLFLGVNALLNWFLVFGGPVPHWKGYGFIGAAISLSISRTMQSVVYFCYMFLYRKHHLKTWPRNNNASTSNEDSDSPAESATATCWLSSCCSNIWKHHTKERTIEFLKQSLPNVGTLLFSVAVSQATTILVGRLGELSIAASSALSTVSMPWSGTLSATLCAISSVRIGYHLGKGNGQAAQKTTQLVLGFLTLVVAIMAIFFLSLQKYVLQVATNDMDVLSMSGTLVVAMLVGTYLNLIVNTITSGVFSGMGRPLIATILSFGLEMPLSIGGVAWYILVHRGKLLGVYWLGALTGAIEAVIVIGIMVTSNWNYWANEVRKRQEATAINEEDNDLVEDSTSGKPFLSLYHLCDKTIRAGETCIIEEGTHLRSQESFAIKIVTKSQLSPKDTESTVMNEISVLKELQHHPNIVRFYDAFPKEPDYCYLVMEKMNGGELFHRIAQKQYFNEGGARNIAKVLFDAIGYCHDHKIAHRDLKPENLIFSNQEDDDYSSLKVCDFGYAKRCPKQGLRTQCGTPGYMAPEVLEGVVSYDTQADVWSLGVTLYILLVGYPPFFDRDDAKLFPQLREEEGDAYHYEFHDAYWKNVSPAAKKLVSSCLTVNPRHRISAQNALRDDAWITNNNDGPMSQKSLPVQPELEKFNEARLARRKLKGDTDAARAVVTFI